jgi:hypothetical protein
MDLVGSAVNYAYSEASPILVVSLSVLYFVAKQWAATPYVLVSGWLVFIAIITAKALLEAYRNGWLRATYRWLEFYLTKAWIKALLGLRYIRDTMIGRTAGLFAVVNLALFGPWVWYNVDLLKWVKSTVELVRTCVKYIADPPALLSAFEVWKGSIPLFGRTLDAGTNYVQRAIRDCKDGSLLVLVKVILVTVCLGVVAILAYALWNWRIVEEWFESNLEILNPQAPGDAPDNDKHPKRKKDSSAAKKVAG